MFYFREFLGNVLSEVRGALRASGRGGAIKKVFLYSPKTRRSVKATVLKLTSFAQLLESTRERDRIKAPVPTNLTPSLNGENLRFFMEQVSG